ncbi:MAG: sulfurtransferase [Pseudomonadota bacterium]
MPDPISSLVSASWLAAKLEPGNADKRPIAVLDASLHLPTAGRDARAEFDEQHIPGACFLDLATLTDRTSPVPAALPNPQQMAQRLSELGIAPDAAIIVYDDSAVKSSARAWFALRALGWPGIAVLDGGLGAWLAAGHKTQSGSGDIQPSAPASLTDAARVKTKADILRVLGDDSAQIIDARAAARVFGDGLDPIHGGLNGRIPGSINLPFDAVFTSDGTYRPPEELRTAFINAGLDLSQPIIATCGSGVTASVLLFALNLIGVSDAELYDGSWSEWGADPETPKAVGPQ